MTIEEMQAKALRFQRKADVALAQSREFERMASKEHDAWVKYMDKAEDLNEEIWKLTWEKIEGRE